MKIIKISEEDYNNLIAFGHTVPKTNYSLFTVSKEYLVYSDNKEEVQVRCTQNCPVNIKIINNLA